MTSLREAKKEATRQALANAAARLVLEEGPDALTVANVTDAAGVSARTFHNYFPSANEALIYFAVQVLDEMKASLDEQFPDMVINDLVSSIVIDTIELQDPPLHSAANVVMISQHLQTRMVTLEERQRMRGIIRALEGMFRHRAPQLDDFELSILLEAYSSVGVHLLQGAQHAIMRGTYDREETRRRVSHAYKMLRPIERIPGE